MNVINKVKIFSLRKVILTFSLMLLLPSLALAQDNQQTRLDLQWVQNSNEYKATTTTIYKLAEKQLQENLKNHKISAVPAYKGKFANLSPAVILDIDETVLDNSKYAVWTNNNNLSYSPKTWDAFVKDEVSVAIPGAKDFINYAKSLGIAVFLVSNRNAGQKQATIKNLAKVGIKIKNPNQFMLFKNEKADWTSDKTSRYLTIAQNYRVIMIVGDNFTDFMPTKGLSYKQYQKLFSKHQGYLGVSWVQLPNPTYGSWFNDEYNKVPLTSWK